MTRKSLIVGASLVAASLFATATNAEPPKDVYDQLVKIGRVVDAPGTTAIYGPILKNQSFAGVTFTRAIHYGPEPRAVLDVATPDAKSNAPRPVLIYVPGGGGNNHLDYTGGEPFMDNIMLAAAHNGLVGVLMQRRAPPGGPWDSGATDIGTVVKWVHDNIARYGGDPKRIVIFGQSAGANNLSNYLSHKQYWGADGVGVKAAILMSGGYNLAPLEPKSVNSAPRGPGDGGAAAVRNPQPAAPPVDPAVQLARSTLPGFKELKIPMFVNGADLDPERTVEVAGMLRDVLCQAGNCPAYQIFKNQSHMSEVLSINSPDKGVEEPIFAWIKKTL